MNQNEVEAKAFRLGQKGLVEFRRIFMPADNEIEPAGFHYLWSEKLIGSNSNEAFEGYRESGKSTIILQAFPLYALTYPRDEWEYIVILKNNQREARKALRNIKIEHRSNPLLSASIKRVLQNTSDVYEVELMCGRVMKIEVYGKGASIRGLLNRDKRPGIIIADDLQDKEDMRSEVIPDNDWEWFLSDLYFLGKHTRVFIIGNNLGEKCIIERISKNPERWGFSFNRIPAANEEMTELTWKAQSTIEELKKERDSFAEGGKLDLWLMEKMCIAVNEEIRTFKESMYRWYTPALKDKLADAGMVMATLDPASSKKSTSCLRAITVGSLMPDGAWYILEAPYGRWDSIELMDKMFEMVMKWGIREFGIEKGQYHQVLEPILYREMSGRNIRFNIVELEHGKLGSKLERIKSMAPIFKSGGIWFPDNDYWVNEMKSELAGVTRDELKSEYVDCIDSLAMLVTQMKQVAPRTARQIKNIANLPTEYVTE